MLLLLRKFWYAWNKSEILARIEAIEELDRKQFWEVKSEIKWVRNKTSAAPIQPTVQIRSAVAVYSILRKRPLSITETISCLRDLKDNDSPGPYILRCVLFWLLSVSELYTDYVEPGSQKICERTLVLSLHWYLKYLVSQWFFWCH